MIALYMLTLLVLTLPSGTGPTGRLCALTCGCEADRVSSRLTNTRCFGTKFFAATFKFGFASTKSTFEVTGCVLVVIADERENTHLEGVVAALVLTALPSGKNRKFFVTSLLQQGSSSLRLVAVAHCCNCFLRFDLELADVDITSLASTAPFEQPLELVRSQDLIPSVSTATRSFHAF